MLEEEKMQVLIVLVEEAPATGCGDGGLDQLSHAEQRKCEGKRRREKMVDGWVIGCVAMPATALGASRRLLQ